MFQKIAYQQLRQLLDQDAQLVEVLPPEEYAEEHLPGAINIPLKQLDGASTAQLDRQRPVIVYCWDYLCDMSPRAAARLDSLGFAKVYDYAPSKVDYLARGLPREGDKAAEKRAVELLREDVVRCGLGERVDQIGPRVEASPYGFAVVLNEQRTVLGRLRGSALEGAGSAPAEELMDLGPSTIRADLPLEKLRERLEGRGLNFAIVTTPEGTLMGIVCRVDLPDR